MRDPFKEFMQQIREMDRMDEAAWIVECEYTPDVFIRRQGKLHHLTISDQQKIAPMYRRYTGRTVSEAFRERWMLWYISPYERDHIVLWYILYTDKSGYELGKMFNLGFQMPSVIAKKLTGKGIRELRKGRDDEDPN